MTVQGKVHAGATKLVGAGLILSDATNTYKQTSDNSWDSSSSTASRRASTRSTAQYFDRVTAAQSVRAVVGTNPKALDFDLAAPDDTSTSDIVGYVGNAVASGGALCPKGNTPAQCALGYTLIKSETATDDHPDPVTINLVEANPPRSRWARRRTTWKVTDPTGKNVIGLDAGLYQLTVSLLGYLPATVTVRVPFNSTAVVPMISLFPANIIGGTIDTIKGAQHQRRRRRCAPGEHQLRRRRASDDHLQPRPDLHRDPQRHHQQLHLAVSGKTGRPNRVPTTSTTTAPTASPGCATAATSCTSSSATRPLSPRLRTMRRQSPTGRPLRTHRTSPARACSYSPSTSSTPTPVTSSHRRWLRRCT